MTKGEYIAIGMQFPEQERAKIACELLGTLPINSPLAPQILIIKSLIEPER